MKHIKLYEEFNSEVNEAVNASGYIKAGKLGYNDQFLGRRSLSYTLSTDLGLDPKNEFSGPWLGFDHVSLYAIGKKGGTILDDALTDKYTYDELKAAAADFMGIKESVVNEAAKPKEVTAVEKLIKAKGEEHFDVEGAWLFNYNTYNNDQEETVQFTWDAENGYDVTDEDGSELYVGTDVKAAVKAFKSAI